MCAVSLGEVESAVRRARPARRAGRLALSPLALRRAARHRACGGGARRGRAGGGGGGDDLGPPRPRPPRRERTATPPRPRRMDGAAHGGRALDPRAGGKGGRRPRPGRARRADGARHLGSGAGLRSGSGGDRTLRFHAYPSPSATSGCSRGGRDGTTSRRRAPAACSSPTATRSSTGRGLASWRRPRSSRRRSPAGATSTGFQRTPSDGFRRAQKPGPPTRARGAPCRKSRRAVSLSWARVRPSAVSGSPSTTVAAVASTPSRLRAALPRR